jgi:RNA polymerase sigma factor (sigma-70 family)
MQEADNRPPELSRLLKAALEEHGEKWFRFALRVLGNHADAEDALQEGVRRVLSSNRSLLTEEQARKYLARAISNTAFEVYKQRKRQRARLAPFPGNMVLKGKADNPYACLEERENERVRERLLSALEEVLPRLPEREYEALWLTLLEPGVGSMRDACASHGIPYSTLRHRRIGGLRRLRRHLVRSLRLSARSHKPM